MRAKDFIMMSQLMRRLGTRLTSRKTLSDEAMAASPESTEASHSRAAKTAWITFATNRAVSNGLNLTLGMTMNFSFLLWFEYIIQIWSSHEYAKKCFEDEIAVGQPHGDDDELVAAFSVAHDDLGAEEAGEHGEEREADADP
jgi:hypothetical protein